MSTRRATSGTFQLSYNGEVTVPIDAAATAFDVRVALEALSAVSTVSVAQDITTELSGAVFSVTQGASTATCVGYASAQCDYIQACDLVRLDGVDYRVQDSQAVGGINVQTFALATANDCGVPTSYAGATNSALPVATWAAGQTWSVTFLSVSTPTVLPLKSPAHLLVPMPGAAVSISGADCIGCFYIGAPPSDALNMGTPYHVRVTAHNAIGDSLPGIAPVDPGETIVKRRTVLYSISHSPSCSFSLNFCSETQSSAPDPPECACHSLVREARYGHVLPTPEHG